MTRISSPPTGTSLSTLSQEIVKQSYAEIGKLDSFKPDNVRWISDDQFAYATGGVTGIMFREKPAANILVGAFWAESLIFAEVGSIAGAIQISYRQHPPDPFFVAACDYCLIGESLRCQRLPSKEPVLLASLVAQDWGKMVEWSLSSLAPSCQR